MIKKWNLPLVANFIFYLLFIFVILFTNSSFKSLISVITLSWKLLILQLLEILTRLELIFFKVSFISPSSEMYNVKWAYSSNLILFFPLYFHFFDGLENVKLTLHSLCWNFPIISKILVSKLIIHFWPGAKYIQVFLD